MKIFISVSILLLLFLEGNAQIGFNFFNEQFKPVRERKAVYFTNERFTKNGEEELLLKAMKPGEQDFLVTFRNGKQVKVIPFDPETTSRNLRFRNENGEDLRLTSEEFLLPLDSISGIRVYLKEHIEKIEKLKPLKEGYRVFATFVVTEEGEVNNIEILKGEYPAQNEEVIKMISEKEDWVPKFINGVPVASRVILPVIFILSNDASPGAEPGQH